MAERERREEGEDEKQMKKGQGGRQSLTGAAPPVLAEVKAGPAAAQVRAPHADTAVLAAVPPVCTRIHGCREQQPITRLSQPLRASTARLLQGCQAAPNTVKQEGKVLVWCSDQLTRL